ncbi:efflux RND transporter permease subunit [Exilibacterium tricleocarpae]|uniref:Efflux RND transporter permease subunit n=2 Tax=Exilibacterium tricleocarpae TaxID=2591008 RepID=A0A545TFT0_9GAMM|nr:efflux RND transporter permease subunit [Exilibacterium tricleocarpae]
MIVIILGGLITAMTIRKQMFPQIEINWIQASIVYPGAAAADVQEGITIKVEEALESVRGLDRIITYSNRGSFIAYMRIDENYDAQEVLDDVKLQVDTISSFPDGIERPVVERIKFEQEVMYLSLVGDLNHRQLKELGREIHDEIRALPFVNVSEFYSGLSYEVGVEVSKDRLREYGLSFQDIVAALNQFSTNRSAGQIRAADGYISVRMESQAYRGHEFEQIPLINLSDGTQIKLGEVATVVDGFQEGINYSKFNGQNAVTLFVGAGSDQSITDVARTVNNYVAEKQAALPQGVSLNVWIDLTYYLEGRLNMMYTNMFYGGVLVFLMLALFLRTRLAFWVMMGLPVCFLGTLFVMPLEWVDVTINVTSLFGFILVLGIVVDDAIVIGESVHAEIERRGQSIDNVVRGAKRVAVPATFGVLTTVAAFGPMVLADGPMAAFSQSIGFVVVFCLLFSLVESKLILPAHLAHMKVKAAGGDGRMTRLRARIDGFLKHFIEAYYRPFLERMIYFRYATIAVFIAVLLVSIGLFQGGIIRYVGEPKIPHDYPEINVEMNASSSENDTLNTARNIQRVLERVEKDVESQYGTGMIQDLLVDMRSRTQVAIMARLVEPEQRPIDTFELAALWRAALPALPGVKTLSIRDDIFSSDRDDGDISFLLEGDNHDELQQATGELKRKLASLKGVGDVNDSREIPAKEVRLTLKPLAYSVGLTVADVAAQTNFSLYGAEAQRIMRDGEEVKVMVRYPDYQRNSVGLVNKVLIQTPEGAEVPLSEVAHIEIVDGYHRIRHENGKQSISVWASVDADQAEPLKITEDINTNFIPQLNEKFPSVSGATAGRIQEEIESRNKQLRDFAISLLVIYALLAIPLKSYIQPVLIMSVIPFGVIGAMLGHLLLGLSMSALSLFGVIAASGVVINDSLVMVDFINQARRRGTALVEAVVQSGCRRFRAILLTSITTFIGLVPIITETSLQAKIVVPMAVSLAFGVLFATVITLLLVPCLYIAGVDIGRLFISLRWQRLGFLLPSGR